MPNWSVALFLSLGLFAQDPAWQMAPSQNRSPDVHYRLREEGQGLRLEILPDGVDTAKWALHIWLGDPRMVEARRKLLGESKAAIAEVAPLLKEPDHQEAYCQKNIAGFLEGARSALRHFRDYDPYDHMQLDFGVSKESTSPRLTLMNLIPAKDVNGATIFVAHLPFTGGFDLAKEDLSALSFGLAYVPKSNHARLPLRFPHIMSLAEPWRVEPFLARGAQRMRILLGPSDESQACLAKPGGYVLARSGSVFGAACFGAEGSFSAPDVWAPIPATDEILLPSSSKRFRFSFLKGNGFSLAVQGQDWKYPVSIAVSEQPSSRGEEGIEVLESADSKDATYLLVQVTGFSRPGSPMSYCGAGEEVDLVWLKLGLDGRPEKTVTALIGSCLTSMELDSRRTDDGRWIWEGDEYGKRKHWKITYDPRSPDQGFTELGSPIPEQ